MARGSVIEQGILPSGENYRIWQDKRSGKKIVYVGSETRDPNKTKHKRHNAPGPHGGTRRSMQWLYDQLKTLNNEIDK